MGVDYGKGVRVMRAARGMSQGEVADTADLTANYICLVEKGAKVPSTNALDAIAGALRAPLWVLVLLGSDGAETETVAPLVLRSLLAKEEG
jgi:transcriptional regulator with XRE-family HTH domain